ncbi:glycosyltransferase 8 domain-containing protein 1 [Xenopus tropicalis]|uniref:Glycosyltransferase 8 domain-containing protein 1 n=2 Tax=Xenopus tropicalis TaxID=8364 RepID=GL8D1_XENTR|nr:glycosyltransferase 8 domain-containing protein 1 [Xenopus tropicalis]Q28I33.1 RecName: Full=Glycosyltransferase 8 domain-containing protein 1 [Xenopus tropicalis]AAI71016.1 glycosyltransferase 8 domain containing 1 [Xenopus tropicalis]AAI71018.1 glycosyltransferase 8 domain containing 1 [Xenopus tropicalis]CAJ81732.1 glycosyltransferase 8 domain containing 1 [Xenopus tropicalis]
MSFRKVHIAIILLAAVVFLLILHHNILGLTDILTRQSSDSAPLVFQRLEALRDAHESPPEERQGEEIAVVIPGVEERLGGLVAAINSISSNTKSNVVFYIITTNDTKGHIRSWLDGTGLKRVTYKLLAFDTRVLDGKVRVDAGAEPVKPMTFARFYLPNLLPETKKAIYLDDDVIVQDDIRDLYNTPLRPGHAAAFSDDCDSVTSKFPVRGAANQYNYIGFLDYKKERIRSLGMRANTCSFNPGVFVANLTEWRRQNVTRQLEKWMELDVAEELYSKTLSASITAPPLLIVFYQRHSNLDPLWHVRHLGSSSGKRYSPQFVKAAKLLHWNGHFKPWGRTSSYPEVWEKWFIPDPMGQFAPIRRHGEADGTK